MKLSIALVTMDREEQLINAINSCLSCELPAKTEFVIIDNCSKDNTEKVVKEFFSSCKYPYIYEKQSENIGAGAGRNRYFELSSGKYIYGMDDDAVIDYKTNPDFFIKAIKIMDDNPRIAALATQIYDEAWQTNRLEINGDKLLDDIYLCKMFCEGSHFLRRNFFKKVPYLPNKYGYEGLPPSLKIWNEGYINAFCPKLLAIHQPRINKWNYENKENYDLLINECAVPYAIKWMMYPKIFRPILGCIFVVRKNKYLKNIPDAENKVRNAVEDIITNYKLDYRIDVKTVVALYKNFGFSIF